MFRFSEHVVHMATGQEFPAYGPGNTVGSAHLLFAATHLPCRPRIPTAMPVLHVFDPALGVAVHESMFSIANGRGVGGTSALVLVPVTESPAVADAAASGALLQTEAAPPPAAALPAIRADMPASPSAPARLDVDIHNHAISRAVMLDLQVHNLAELLREACSSSVSARSQVALRASKMSAASMPKSVLDLLSEITAGKLKTSTPASKSSRSIQGATAVIDAPSKPTQVIRGTFLGT